MKQTEAVAELRSLAVDTPVGVIKLVGTPGELKRVHLPKEAMKSSTNPKPLGGRESYPALTEAADWLRRYFAGEKSNWLDKPMPEVSTFRKKIYATLCTVPAGVVVSYGELASMAGYPKAARAVGRAMATNPLSIFIPCHRVLGSDGSLHGYGGGLELKRKLLEHEGAPVK